MFSAFAVIALPSIRSDKGRVRYGWYNKADGSKVPRHYESEVAVIAFAVQEILMNRGLVDEAGNLVPAKALVKAGAAKVTDFANVIKPAQSVEADQAMTPGKKCVECGAHAVIKKDGCEFCTHCGHTGACG